MQLVCIWEIGMYLLPDALASSAWKRHKGFPLECFVKNSNFYWGPDYTWHVDGYNKLKPYGFAIHDCIDGYEKS